MKVINKYKDTNLILRIVLGLIIGTIFGVLINLALEQNEGFFASSFAETFLTAVAVLLKILGNLFIGGLRAIAPVLVFFLISSSLMGSQKAGSKTVQKTMGLYAFGTFSAALVAVVINLACKVKLILPSDIDTSSCSSLSGLSDVFVNLFNDIVQNPIAAVSEGNFIGVLF